jgi:hypothetical protein
MRKFIALVLLAVALAGGTVAVVTFHPTPALACDSSNC